MHIILNELLRAHYTFLGPVRRAWKAQDEFKNGFLGRDKLESVLETLNTDRQLGVQPLLDELLHGNVDVATFSSLVRTLAGNTIEGKNSTSLLQFFYDKNN